MDPHPNPSSRARTLKRRNSAQQPGTKPSTLRPCILHCHSPHPTTNTKQPENCYKTRTRIETTNSKPCGVPPRRHQLRRRRHCPRATCLSTLSHLWPSPALGFIWRFPKIRGTILGVPRIRTIVHLGLCWGPPILGNYHMSLEDLKC